MGKVPVQWSSTFNTQDLSFCFQTSRLTVENSRMFLAVLGRHLPNLPRDPRTLLGTPRECKTYPVGMGTYVHIGLNKELKRQVLFSGTNSMSSISIQLHIDGVSIYNSSRTQLWPILARINQPHREQPFVVSIYGGPSKPQCLQSFLQPCIDELNNLLQNGLVLDDCTTLSVILSAVICDTPARSFVRQVKGHSGYYGCDKCVQKGVRHERVMTFPLTDSPLRNDYNYRQLRPNHSIGNSPFLQLPIDMVSCFPVDYMHSVCLGVTKRLLSLWLSSPIQRNLRIGRNVVQLLNEGIRSLHPSLSSDFQRRYRTLDDVERWKATEFRQFLFYLAPVLLKYTIDPCKYNNFSRIFYSHVYFITSYFVQFL